MENMNTVSVKVKWNKQLFDDVEFDLSGDVLQFKTQLYSLTGVPVDRQKLMAKGAWTGILKNEQNLELLKVKPGQTIMLMGTADVVQAPDIPVAFVEDMTSEEKAEKGAVVPAGLINLQNTCYMNATVQCFRSMHSLRKDLNKLTSGLGGSQAVSFMSSFRDMLNMLDSAGQSIPPVMFVSMLRNQFPQFAQTGPQGGYMQQDAEEFYNTLMQMINESLNSLGAAGDTHDSGLNIQLEETLSCTESDSEPRVVRREIVNRLVCNIQGGPGTVTSINHLSEGLKLGLEGTVEKNSSVLDRNALWTKQQRISKLPRYLCIQFMRFFWKPTPESRDHAGVKCKILRPVSFAETFDVYDFCTESLQERLKLNRLKKNRREEELLELKRRKVLEGDAADEVGPTVEMEVIAEGTSESPTLTGSADVGPPPPAVSVSEQDISIPLQSDFSTGLSGDFIGEYELMGVVTHKGRSADSGHYIGWVRQNPGSDYWWRYDDDVVTEVLTTEILNLKGGGDWHTAYLNFYVAKE